MCGILNYFKSKAKKSCSDAEATLNDRNPSGGGEKVRRVVYIPVWRGGCKQVRMG